MIDYACTYLTINLCVISIPLLLSFNSFYRPEKLRSLLIGIFLSALFFIVWDIWFTNLGIWGFNETYTLGVHVFGLPVEEILFFFTIPYASLFLMSVLDRFLFVWIPETVSSMIVSLLALVALIGGVLYYDRLYSLVNAVVLLNVLLIVFLRDRSLLAHFLGGFLCIIPFFILTNGILTGILGEPVVWYNSSEIIGYRLWSIPIEDLFYAFSLLLLPYFLQHRIAKFIEPDYW